MSNPREFVREEYDRYNQISITTFSDHLEKRGHTIIQSEEDYLHDIISEKDGVRYYFELEVKVDYPFRSRRSYPFSTVSFTSRKLRLHKIKPFIYIILCLETLSYLYCDSTTIYNEEYCESVKIHTKNRQGVDLLYRVPKSKCRFRRL